MENKQCKECSLYNSLGCPYAGYDDWEENEECDEFRPLENCDEIEVFWMILIYNIDEQIYFINHIFLLIILYIKSFYGQK